MPPFLLPSLVAALVELRGEVSAEFASLRTELSRWRWRRARAAVAQAHAQVDHGPAPLKMPAASPSRPSVRRAA